MLFLNGNYIFSKSN
uniref:Uncharacterized protein n=2 Tax=Anguilla anguilla TaxID=7936 RepID=A0A0E9V8N4_ANGAN